MKHLSCDAQHLVKLTRDIDGPDPSRCGKVRAGLSAVLAAGTTSAAANAALAQASLATSPTLTAGGAAAAVGAAKSMLVGSGVVGGIVTGFGVGTVLLATVHFTASPSIDSAPTAASAISSAAPIATYREAPRSAASSVDVDSTPANVTAAVKVGGLGSTNRRATPVSVEATATTADAASLAEETRLLVQTQLAIRTSDPERALALVDEYDRRFGSGSLREEARAARILALCRAGRIEEGQAAAASFERQFPSSPLVPRVRRSCDPER